MLLIYKKWVENIDLSYNRIYWLTTLRFLVFQLRVLIRWHIKFNNATVKTKTYIQGKIYTSFQNLVLSYSLQNLWYNLAHIVYFVKSSIFVHIIKSKYQYNQVKNLQCSLRDFARLKKNCLCFKLCSCANLKAYFINLSF